MEDAEIKETEFSKADDMAVEAAGPWLLLSRMFGSVIVLLSVAWALDLPSYFGLLLFREQLLAVALVMAVVTVFINTSWRLHTQASPRWHDLVLAVLFFGVGLYVAFDYQYFMVAVATRSWDVVILGIIFVLGVLEATRRAVGWTLFFIVIVFCAYALVANLVPAPLTGRHINMSMLSVYLAYDPSAILGLPLAITITTVVLFIFFGQILFVTGGGNFFTDLAMALVGNHKGGAAKISVLSSALFGSISGSAVSNVATTGIVTVPLMKKSGYSAVTAGAIEAVASTGGQMLPPIMGAAAFLMAEFLDISYQAIILAALGPALLYYFAVFLQIHLIAARDGIKPLEENRPRASKILLKGWHFFIPFGVLLTLLFRYRMEAPEAAIYAAAAMLFVGLVRPYDQARAGVTKSFQALARAGLDCVPLIVIVASAGIVIGVLNATGGGFALTLALLQFSGNNMIILLLISAAICIVLGMGMPTSGVYVLLSALVAPAIVQAGVQPLAAHMFILYFGMMSMITPPIALAAFAAASISGAKPLRTGVVSMQLGWVAYVVPFLFVFSPAILLLNDDPAKIAWVFATTTAGVFFITIAAIGYLFRRLNLFLRGLLFLIGVCSVMPSSAFARGSLIDAIAIVAGMALITYVFLSRGGSERFALGGEGCDCIKRGRVVDDSIR